MIYVYLDDRKQPLLNSFLLRGLIVLLLLPAFVQAQVRSRIDSLLVKLASVRDDSARANVLNGLTWNYHKISLDTAITYGKQALLAAERSGAKSELAKAYSYTGSIFYTRGDYNEAREYFKKSIAIDRQRDDKKGLIKSMVNLSRTYSVQGDVQQGLGFLFEALKLAQAIDDKQEVANCYYTIAVLYDRQNEHEKAVTYGKNALEIYKTVGDSAGIAASLHRTGLAYISLRRYDDALSCLERSLVIRERLGTTTSIAASLNGIGLVYLDTKKYDNALVNFSRALKLWTSLGDKEGMTIVNDNIGLLYFKLEDNDKALQYFMRSYEVADEINSIVFLKNAALNIAEVHARKNDYRSAYKYYRRFSELKDTLFNEESAQKLAQMQSYYESDKKEQRIALLLKEKQLQESDNDRNKLLRNVSIGGSVIFLLFGFVVFSRYRVKQKANVKLQNAYEEIGQQNTRLHAAYSEIEKHRDEIAAKNKEITDSIQYAQRIQSAILPNDEYFKKLLPDSFILYKPKDIVSGDFYWAEQWGDRVLVAAVDCTGHGVPGALMSVVGCNLLNQAVNEHGLYKPNLILNAVNKGLAKSLKQKHGEVTVKDGMDISLFALDRNRMKLEFAGAFNSLWLVRNGSLIEIKGDKFPVGLFVGEEQKQFANHEADVQPGDAIYIFTDGYADQFGGPSGKKFKYRKLQELLLSINNKSMQEQGRVLGLTIDQWRGDLEQVDDICVIGVRV
jgi:serine phosphatase RsbU (regulator of sigma subunit)